MKVCIDALIIITTGPGAAPRETSACIGCQVRKGREDGVRKLREQTVLKGSKGRCRERAGRQNKQQGAEERPWQGEDT